MLSLGGEDAYRAPTDEEIWNVPAEMPKQCKWCGEYNCPNFEIHNGLAKEMEK